VREVFEEVERSHAMRSALREELGHARIVLGRADSPEAIAAAESTVKDIEKALRDATPAAIAEQDRRAQEPRDPAPR
jgi:hypothetical protein